MIVHYQVADRSIELLEAKSVIQQIAVTFPKKSEKCVSGHLQILVYRPPIIPLMLILQLGMHKFIIIVV